MRKKALLIIVFLLLVLSLISCVSKNEKCDCSTCTVCGGCLEVECCENENCRCDFACAGHEDENGFIVRGTTVLSYVGTDSIISVPEGIERISEKAFFHNSNLTSVTIPDSVTEVGADAFVGCPNLEYDLFEGQEYIDNVLINILNPREITSINLKPTITATQSDVFGDCNMLSEITVDSTNTRFKSNGGILFSKDETTIIRCPRAAIFGRYSIPQNVNTIGYRAFSDCKGLTEIIIHNNIKAIGEAAFDACYSLTSLSIPGSVESIGKAAFVNCHQLTTIVVGQGTRTIEDLAFFGNGQLVSITIPSSVEYIGADAFNHCHKNCQLNFDGTQERWDSITQKDIYSAISPIINFVE